MIKKPKDLNSLGYIYNYKMSIKLCLGAGTVNLGRDWVHIDGSKNDSTHKHCKYSSITDLSQFEDNSVEILYSSHTLEYFDQIEVVDVLREWYRVLKKGGIIRLAVPDFEVLVKLYSLKDNLVEAELPNKEKIVIKNPRKMKIRDLIGPLFGRMEMNGKTIYHRNTFDFETLAQLLYQVGFKRITRYDYEYVKPHNKIDDSSHSYFPHDPEAIKKGKFKNHTLISLNVEGTK